MAYDVPITAGVVTDGVKAGFAEITNQASRMRSDIARTFGQAIAFTGLSGALTGVINLADRAQDLSEKFGVNASVLLQWSNAREKVGTSMEGIAASMNKLEINRSKALSGDAAMLEHFRQLGITAEDLRKLSLDQLLLKIGSSSMDAAQLVAVLGRNALELRPLLDGLADESIRLGKAMSEDTIRGLDEMSDALKQLKQDIIGFSGTFLVGAANLWKVYIAKIVGDALVAKEEISAAFKGIERAIRLDFDGAIKAFKQGMADANVIADEQRKLRGEIWNGTPNDAPAGPRRRRDDDDSSPLAASTRAGSRDRESAAASENRAEETRQRLIRENYLKTLDLQDKIRAIEEERGHLQDELNADASFGVMTADERAEAENEILKLEGQSLDLNNRMAEQREKMADVAERDLSAAERRNQLLRLSISGSAEQARYLERQWQLEDQIAAVNARIADARRHGADAAVKALEALSAQLAAEKEIVAIEEGRRRAREGFGAHPGTNNILNAIAGNVSIGGDPFVTAATNEVTGKVDEELLKKLRLEYERGMTEWALRGYQGPIPQMPDVAQKAQRIAAAQVKAAQEAEKELLRKRLVDINAQLVGGPAAAAAAGNVPPPSVAAAANPFGAAPGAVNLSMAQLAQIGQQILTQLQSTHSVIQGEPGGG